MNLFVVYICIFCRHFPFFTLSTANNITTSRIHTAFCCTMAVHAFAAAPAFLHSSTGREKQMRKQHTTRIPAFINRCKTAHNTHSCIYQQMQNSTQHAFLHLSTGPDKRLQSHSCTYRLDLRNRLRSSCTRILAMPIKSCSWHALPRVCVYVSLVFACYLYQWM